MNIFGMGNHKRFKVNSTIFTYLMALLPRGIHCSTPELKVSFLQNYPFVLFIQGTQKLPLNLPCNKESDHALRLRFVHHGGFNFKENQNCSSGPYCLVLGGILSFLGLDEDSKEERKYDREVDSNKDKDFDEKLRNILRPAIFNMQVSRYVLL